MLPFPTRAPKQKWIISIKVVFPAPFLDFSLPFATSFIRSATIILYPLFSFTVLKVSA